MSGRGRKRHQDLPVWWVRDNTKARGTTRHVLMEIAAHADKDGIAFPTQETLAEAVDIDPRWIRKHIRKLEEMGELRSFGIEELNDPRAGTDRRRKGYQILMQPEIPDAHVRYPKEEDGQLPDAHVRYLRPVPAPERPTTGRQRPLDTGHPRPPKKTEEEDREEHSSSAPPVAHPVERAAAEEVAALNEHQTILLAELRPIVPRVDSDELDWLRRTEAEAPDGVDFLEAVKRWAAWVADKPSQRKRWHGSLYSWVHDPRTRQNGGRRRLGPGLDYLGQGACTWEDDCPHCKALDGDKPVDSEEAW